MSFEDNIIENIKILYVEDDEFIREGFERLLSSWTKNLCTATNGTEGLEAYKKYQPDIVISDIKMPIMDGIQMAKSIREFEQNKSLKQSGIIFTTAHGEGSYMQDAISLRVYGYLVKPVSKNDLKELLMRVSKSINYDIEKKRQSDILQSVIDTESNMIVATNGNEILFANRAFYDFFCIENKEEFYKEYNDFWSIFGDQHVLLDTNDSKDDGHNVVLLHNKKTDTENFFQIRIKPLEGQNDFFLFSFTDISKVIKEKNIIEEKANIDDLTKIHNRLKFNEVLDEKIYHASIDDSFYFSVILFDIDFFKEINDTFGHLRGDKMLADIANIVNNNIRKTDFFARWGGEEFVIILDQTKAPEAFRIAENLRKVLENIDYGDIQRSVTCSFGIAEFETYDKRDTLVKKVDSALYEAKKSGRNCVKTYSSKN
ncbi:MAG: diguanylate cyclase [Sulfurospirillaceae bacterium]|nr:diguanylate cyclase [Sulfurospirillaceae bacterium]